MKKIVRELADEAGFMDSWFSESGDDCERELKKFADLIIKECENVALKVSLREDDMGAIIANMIRKHFGVY